VCVCVCFSVIHRVASHIQSRGIAHNLFITRGSRFDVDSKQTKDDRGAGQQTSTVRAYLWPRKSFFGNFSFFTSVCVFVFHFGLNA